MNFWLFLGLHEDAGAAFAKQTVEANQSPLLCQEIDLLRPSPFATHAAQHLGHTVLYITRRPEGPAPAEVAPCGECGNDFEAYNCECEAPTFEHFDY